MYASLTHNELKIREIGLEVLLGVVRRVGNEEAVRQRLVEDFTKQVHELDEEEQ